MRTLFTVFLVGVCVAGAAKAADRSHGTRGVTAVDVIVDQTDAAADCGISQAAVEAAMRLPIAATKLKTSSDSLAYLYAQIVAIKLTSSACAVHIGVSFVRPVLAGSAGLTAGTTFSKSMLMSGDKLEMPRRVDQQVESFAKQFLSVWLKENE